MTKAVSRSPDCQFHLINERMSRLRHSWTDGILRQRKGVGHEITSFNGKGRGNFSKRNRLTLLERTVDHQDTGINSENAEDKISRGSPEHVETSSTSQITIKYANQGDGTSPPFADDCSGRSFFDLMLDLRRKQTSVLTLPPTCTEVPCFSGDPGN